METAALCLYLESACKSPECEALESALGVALTTVTVCEVGVCIKTVAKVNIDGANLKGVSTGFGGVCACVATESSGLEKTDTADHLDDLVKPAVVVSLLVAVIGA